MQNSNILLDLYACPADPGRWRHTLDQLCFRLGARSVAVQRLRKSASGLEHPWTVRDSQSTFHAALHDRLINNSENPRYQADIVNPRMFGRIIRDSEQFAHSSDAAVELFRRRLEEARLGRAIGAIKPVSPNEAIAIIVHRDIDNPRIFDAEEESLLLDLLPHIGQASELTWQTIRRDQLSKDAQAFADALSVGVIQLDNTGSIAWLNEAATDLLGKSPHLSASPSKLRAVRHEDRIALARLCAGSPGHDGQQDFVVFGAGEDDELQIMRLRNPSGGNGNILLLTTPRLHAPPALHTVAQVLGVTMAEARIGAALMQGHTVASYASSRGLSEGSVRNQLKQVFAKTGLRRQSDVVGYLANSVTSFARPG